MVEVPEEIVLGLTILGCPIHCPDCHSSWSWSKNYPQKLINAENISKLLTPYHTGLLFFGGEWEADFQQTLEQLQDWFHLPLALYTGLSTEEAFAKPWINLLTFIKTGPYIQELGNLRSPTTNQRMFRLEQGKIQREYKFYGSE